MFTTVLTKELRYLFRLAKLGVENEKGMAIGGPYERRWNEIERTLKELKKKYLKKTPTRAEIQNTLAGAQLRRKIRVEP